MERKGTGVGWVKRKGGSRFCGWGGRGGVRLKDGE